MLHNQLFTKTMKANSKFPQDITKVIPWNTNPSYNTVNQERTYGNTPKEDLELKQSVSNIIKWNSCIDETKIKVTVENGWVTLEGKADLEYKRTKAELLAKDIMGVTGVTNLITISNNTSGTA